MKIVLNKPTSGFNLAAINDNFDKIEEALQEQVLYRNNPVGEPNAVLTDIDMNGRAILNLSSLQVSGVNIDGLNSAFVWRGTWSGATSYARSDAVYYNGSSYICVTPHTNSAPPSANWNLLASQGASGAGTGDVIGPASAVGNTVAIYNGVTGKLLADSGVTVASLMSSGATGGGSDRVFWKNDKTITTNYTITSTENAGTFGPVTINNGVTVTVDTGATWTVV
jgi:hypothetical protein